MSHDARLRLQIRLYVAGAAPNSVAAVSNLHDALSGLAEDQVDLEVIDVVKAPERGLAVGVFVTPMLVKLAPSPERRVLGNLSDRPTLLAVLGLEANS